MSLALKDRKFIWHPFTQEKVSAIPIPIIRGEAEFLFTEDERQLIDAISSWWVNIHGHANSYISERISEQLGRLHQVIFAGFTHQPAITLAEKLLNLLPRNFAKIFYSDDGSTSVEVALKMAIQFWHNQRPGDLSERTKIIAFEGGYHGDTFGAMSAGDRTAFSAPFNPYLFDVIRIPVPKGPAELELALSGVEKVKTCAAALIYEPLIQGAAGMVIYPSENLEKLLSLCRKNRILLIADEVMTGFGRTGTLFASDPLNIKPDIICLSKGITGGSLPLGVTTCTDEIYQAFYSDDRYKAFFHGHSYTANPLSCTAAIASIELLEKKEVQDSITRISESQSAFIAAIRTHPKVMNAQALGTISRLEVITEELGGYFNSIRDKLYQEFLSRGILLRPLGNVIYVMPPYCISAGSLGKVYSAINEVLEAL